MPIESKKEIELEIAHVLFIDIVGYSKLLIDERMGIHSGPVGGITDVNDRSNVSGAGINLAQRVMDCGDVGTFFCPSMWLTTWNSIASGALICTTWGNAK